MKWLKKILLILLITFLVIQFIQPARNKNQPLLATDITKIFDVPDTVLSVFKIACYDCHSNNTNYPWYSRIQPFGWLLANHIKNGKAKINFSEFGSYRLRRQNSKLKNIEGSIKDGSMPLWSYILIHHAAKLSKKGKRIIIDWVEKTRDSLSR